MEKKLNIHLNGLRFFGPYGLYPVESKWSIELIIDVSISLKVINQDLIELKDTIDYTEIYKTIQLLMKQDHRLLESMASVLIDGIKKSDARIETCKISIQKKAILNGPSEGVVVELEY